MPPIGGFRPPLEVLRDKSATREDLTAPFHDFFSLKSCASFDKICGDRMYRYEATPLFVNTCQPKIGSIF